MPLLIALAGALVFTALMVTGLRRVARAAARSAADDPATVGALDTAAAVLGGLHAVGMRRTRGNGVLVRLPDRLRFVLAVPRRTLDIPLAAVTDVEVSKVLRVPGRYVRQLRPWLIVRWSAEGQEAIAGFLMADPRSWAHAIRPDDWRDTTG